MCVVPSEAYNPTPVVLTIQRPVSPPVRSGINPTHSVDSLGCLDLKNPGSPHSDFLELMLGGPGFVILVLPCADIPTSLRFLYSRSEHIPDAPFYLLLPCSESFSSHQQGQIRPYIPQVCMRL